jgi:plastocyanin
MPRAPKLCAAALTLLALAAAASAHAEGRALRGRVVLAAGEGISLGDVAPVVVYLEGAGLRRAGPPAKPALIAQEGASFRPDFAVVAVGQSIDLPNRDDIVHNVFSFSEHNAFDLGLYPQGQMRRITLQHPGVVRVYCSIHESMNATVLVVPSPFFARVDAQGGFAIRGVPPGRYRLHVWSDMLPMQERTLDFTPGSAPLEIAIEARASPARREAAR